MEGMKRGNSIGRIIAMEERISKCTRCPLQRRCVSKPATGKGDLAPDIFLIFQSQSNKNNDIKKIIEIRQMIKKDFQMDKIYHTFLVRCQPKACTHIDNLNCNSSKILVDEEQKCRISKNVCEGIPIKPGDDEIFSCIHYLVEEIDILSPGIIIVFSERAADYVLKAMGIFESATMPGMYIKNDRYIFTTVEEENFNHDNSKRLASLITAVHADLA